MSDGAHVESVEAIDRFRTSLIAYLAKVRPLLQDSADEVVRAREWLRVERRKYWEQQIKFYTRKLSEAQQALFSAELAKLRRATTAEQEAVHAARRGLSHAEEKLRTVKRSLTHFEKEVEPKLKQLEQLRSITMAGGPKAVQTLKNLIEQLEAYGQIRPVASGEINGQPRAEAVESGTANEGNVEGA
jgi:hypothetical protein